MTDLSSNDAFDDASQTRAADDVVKRIIAFDKCRTKAPLIITDDD